jgi:hypothetical protein
MLFAFFGTCSYFRALLRIDAIIYLKKIQIKKEKAAKYPNITTPDITVFDHVSVKVHEPTFSITTNYLS